MQTYAQATPTSLDMDNTYQLDILKSKYANIRYGVSIDRRITIDAKYEANLPGLAYDVYGDVNMWRIILAVNGLSDPLNDVVVGTVLALPNKASVDAYLAAGNAKLTKSMVI